MITGPLPPVPRALLEEVAELLAVERFLIFGGIALDMLLDAEAATQDIDVAIDAHSYRVEPTIAALLGAGLRAGPLREYRINRHEPVWMLNLFWGDRVLDLNFVVRSDRIGQFDIETLVWRWPERDFVDRHGAGAALRRGTIRLVRNVDCEDPLLLLARLLKLTAKYGLRITDPAHSEMVAALDNALAGWRSPDEAHPRAVEERQAAIVRRGCARAADPVAFLSEVHASGLLRHTAPGLHASLERRTVQRIAR